MIARISLLLLLANSAIALAQPLYKWTEADGSITFSPTPPAGGIPYETFNTGAARPDAPALAAAVASTGATTAASSSKSDSPGAKPVVRYAPGGDKPLPAGLSRTTAAAKDSLKRPANVERSPQQVLPSNTSGTSTGISAESYKRSRCADLRKRVTSLEQRLRQPLTPEDMDNTVVHMARYQRSHDQYCVQ